jgi:hypothetical protein
MVEVRNDPYDRPVVVRKSSAGRTIAILLILALAIIGLLFATGFWTAKTSGGNLWTSIPNR